MPSVCNGRPELIEAKWDQFDLDAAVWRIPADAMKMRKKHWAYLSARAVEMLREIGGATYVFPSTRGRLEAPIAKPTLNTAVKSLCLAMEHFVLHSLRRTAFTHQHEMGLPSDVIEKALLHEIKGIKGVNNRAEYAASFSTGHRL
ncbi:tyrosine-type recombinase/integrase [Cupriavidus sp. PET2-C1]